MINLLQYLNSLIDGWLEEVPSNQEYPYIVYRLTGLEEMDESNRRDFLLQVDIYDKSQDAMEIEILADTVDEMLNRKKHLEEGLAVRVYRNSRNMITEDGLDIKRRQLRYEVQAYIL